MDKINNKIGASNHGLERLLERTHCKRGDVLDFLTKIWESGKTIESYNRKSRMFTYLKNVRYNGGNDREVRVHGNTVYIFNKKGSTLITCCNIPQGVIQNKTKIKK